jgi:hypothetical protein
MERPINFLKCSLSRRFLKIPCDVEIGENYKDLKKYKFPQLIEPLIVVPQETRIKTITEQFMVQE